MYRIEEKMAYQSVPSFSCTNCTYMILEESASQKGGQREGG